MAKTSSHSLALKIRYLIQNLLKVLVADLVSQGRNKRLGFFGSFAAQRAYT